MAFVVRLVSALARSSDEPSTASRSLAGRSTSRRTPCNRAVAVDSVATSLISSVSETIVCGLASRVPCTRESANRSSTRTLIRATVARR